MKDLVIKIQAEWDNKGVPVECQDWTLRHIFEGLSSTADDDPGVSLEDRLAPLIGAIPKDWDGSLDYIRRGDSCNPRGGGCALV